MTQGTYREECRGILKVFETYSSCSNLVQVCSEFVRVEIVVDIVSMRNAKMIESVYDLRCGRITGSGATGGYLWQRWTFFFTYHSYTMLGTILYHLDFA
jgi:hypothetical protein